MTPDTIHDLFFACNRPVLVGGSIREMVKVIKTIPDQPASADAAHSDIPVTLKIFKGPWDHKSLEALKRTDIPVRGELVIADFGQYFRGEANPDFEGWLGETKGVCILIKQGEFHLLIEMFEGGILDPHEVARF